MRTHFEVGVCPDFYLDNMSWNFLTLEILQILWANEAFYVNVNCTHFCENIRGLDRRRKLIMQSII
jgi:hypothetical protein